MRALEELPVAPIPGGDYHWTQNPGGGWDVDDVLIFAEMPEKGIDAAWITAAVARSKHRLTQNRYMSPLHLHHSDDDNNPHPMFAGLYWLSSAELIRYEDKDIMAARANFRNVPTHVYEQIRAGQMPFASVEVHDIRKFEIDSLALMDGVVPRFRFPLIRVASEHRLVASAAASESESGFFLTHPFSGGETVKDIDPKKPGLKAAQDPPADPPAEPPVEPPEPDVELTEGEQMIQTKLDTLITMIQQLVEKLGATPPAETPPVTPPAAPAGVPAEQMAAAARAELKTSLDAAVKPLIEKVEKLEGAQTTRALMASANESLKGYLLTPEDGKRLHAAAALGKEYVTPLVDSLKAHAQKIPSTSSKAEESLSAPATDDDVVKCAAILGDEPQTLQVLRAKADEYDSFVESGMIAADVNKDGVDVKRERFIKREAQLTLGA